MKETASESKELVAFLREQVGEHLRSVLYYDDSDWDVLFVCDDVADAYDERNARTFSEICASKRSRNPTRKTSTSTDR
ncbi:hypothetical protein [Haladaptatus halobius]|uniref:hypothetical protein n=1 Tax=Haladaptatus halobius TaxID=2884875 RepID=UPI001D0B5C34|nr:hypothetical protein [Haladaptatus halobius]